MDLAAVTLRALLERTDVDPGAVDEHVAGCSGNSGPQAADIARDGWLAAGFPEHVPSTTVDGRCGPSQQAVHPAAQAVMAGVADLVAGSGVQTTLLHELERTGGRCGLQTMCQGGGQANVTIVERL